jgi:queuine/archaeosine tRNA-ribosyltransferase
MDILIDHDNFIKEKMILLIENSTYLSVHEQHVIVVVSLGIINFERVSVPYINDSGRFKLFSL